MDELEKDLTEEEIKAMRSESLAILYSLNFRDELLKLEVRNGCSSIPLEDYKLTDEELKFLEDKIIEEIRVAIENQDLQLNLNHEIWDWVQELPNQKVTTVFTAKGHEWELSHGRFNTMVRWLNPNRDQEGQQRYYPGNKGVQACSEIQIPMDSNEALAWTHECLDEEFFNFFGVPITEPISADS